MPYITFSEQRKDGTTSEEYQKLLKCYENTNVVMHGTRTLDEFYYHFERDHASEEERRRRNKDQIVTAELNAGGDVAECESWTILTVDQLWLWVINESELKHSPLGLSRRSNGLTLVRIHHYVVDSPRRRRRRHCSYYRSKLPQQHPRKRAGAAAARLCHRDEQIYRRLLRRVLRTLTRGCRLDD